MPMRLVPLRPEDVPAAAALLLESAEWAAHSAFNTDPGSILFNPSATWLTVLAADEVIGIVGVHSINWIDRAGELAGGTMPNWRGKGAGAPAFNLLVEHCFNDLGLHRLSVTTLVGSPSEKIARACNFVVEGQHKAARFKGGRFHDTVTLALVKEG